ncbi:hypothetical protein [Methylobacterium oryzihabitans]|jgi:hypothetical protein|uniref:Uncharacterized protein n=1 Tax=Methylobacterium oryzihabitans TaxID=2499852 RepID=A0A3S2VCY1_9HYPH|nr:hypothetical protein [Methylobacterium oryzihabitans]RVU20059.1 hypothetical protein EOE48_05445 [Methylobacterium oryzihabitans]
MILRDVLSRRRSAGVSSHDNSVVLVIALMMTLVFAPVVGLHVAAALGVTDGGHGEVASVAVPAKRPPG